MCRRPLASASLTIVGNLRVTRYQHEDGTVCEREESADAGHRSR
ncbi:MAG TPA: hypothetical protein VMX54_21355 [Vicinamibacteria bacterium]|nr:hypothetical protein [Vicinamibacteria bacterium]